PLDGPVTVLDLGANGRSSAPEANLLFRSFIASNGTPSQSLNVSSNASRRLGFFVVAAAPALSPRLIGLNGELCTVALPLQRGGTFTVYVAGEGMDEVPPEGIS